MRYISAELVYPVSDKPVTNGIVVIEYDKVLDVFDPQKDDISPDWPVEKFGGIICPGFVNAHCHLELSHLKGKLSRHKSLTGFISEIITKRGESKSEIESAMIAADKEMFASGINAVGDISNLSVSLPIKKSSSIHYHTFIELFDLDDSRALEVFNNGLALCEEFKQADLCVSIVPHSPYTVSEKLFKLIADYSEENKSIVCIHNQETESENEMFERGKGPLMELMKKSSVAFQQWKPSELSSLKTFIPYFIHSTLQLVHNTFTSESDVNFAMKHHHKLFWCLCVNANLFIENKVPDIELFRKKECKMTIGTDSYASNDSLSVLDELKTISRIYPQVSLDDLLKWSSLHGAEMLGIDAQYGSIAKGKRPGIINISDVDISGRKISQESRVKRVV